MPKLPYSVEGVIHTASLGTKREVPIYQKDGTVKNIIGYNLTFTSIPNGSFAYVEDASKCYLVDKITGVWLYDSALSGKAPKDRMEEILANKAFMEVFDSPSKLESFQIGLVENPIRKVSYENF